MGEMIDGVWRRGRAGAATSDGAFARPRTVFREHIAPGGRFPPASGRYHLYVSLACPWAHRTIIFRRVKGLEPHIGLSVMHWLMGEDGWTFEPAEGVIPDPLGARFLHEVYARADPAYTGRVTVPVLWDMEERTIVNNESADIIRMFNSAFDQLGATAGDYYPEALRPEIEALNERIYATLNNGVYRAGFATTQAAYDAAVAELFGTLDWLEEWLSRQAFLCGEVVTEADWRLFTTLIRFDAVYHGHFKCNVRRLADYPALSAYTSSCYRMPGIAETVSLDHIKRHYYLSHPWLDPSGIVPAGPALDFAAPVDEPLVWHAAGAK
jgi:glutathionyl-hydroquinone reductase